MQIIPVLDLKGGVVVRGVGGRRAEYRPIVSQLTESSQPVDVAEAFRARFGLTDLYLADLDAIGGAAPDLGVYEALQQRGFRLRVDAGVRDLSQATALAQAGVEDIVVGLETIRGPDQLAVIVREYGERVIFSLDLKGSEPLGELSGWQGSDPWSLAVQAIRLGIQQLLVLDLERVGEDRGPGTAEFCEQLTTTFRRIAVLTGGGVRDVEDLRLLRLCGVSAVLVASALHDGRLRPEDLAKL